MALLPEIQSIACQLNQNVSEEIFKHGTDLHIWNDAKITSSKWQKKMLAGGMRRNICREWRKYFCKDAANPSEPAEQKTSDSELEKESTNAGSQLLTVNLGK